MSAALVPAQIPLPSAFREVAPLASQLDALDHAGRLAWVRSLPTRELHTLWDLCAGRGVPLSHYCAEDGKPVIHHGWNSLFFPPLRAFQKRFAYVDGKIAGYNHPEGLGAYVVWFQGYGPFTVVESERGDGEAWVDYRKLPPQHPDFPPVAPNRWGRWIVYGGMIDAMRRVSEHVTVGNSDSKAFPVGVNEKFILVKEG